VAFPTTETPQPLYAPQRSLTPLWLLGLPIFLLLVFWLAKRRADSPLYTLRSHNSGNVVSLAFSPDGKVLASGTVGASDSDDNGTSWEGTEVQLWDTQTATLLHTLKGRSGELKCIAFSPNGRVVAGGSNGTAPVDTDSENNGRADESLFSIRLWDVRSGALLRVIPGTRAEIHTLNFLPNRCLVTLHSLNNNVALGKTREPGQIQPIRHIKDTDSINALALSPDGNTIACSTWERKEVPIIHLWNAQTGRLLYTLRGHTDMVPNMVFSPDGRMLASGVAAQAPNPSEIKLWDVNSGKLITTLNGNRAQVTCLAFAPDDKTLVNGSSDDTIKLWDVPTGQLRRTIKSGTEMDALTFTGDGKTLAGGGTDSIIKLWNIG